MMKNIDRTADFGRATPIYEVLTTMGKDNAGEHTLASPLAHTMPMIANFNLIEA
jgi:hypothetical protein